jgi:ABC-type nickel/cobalt efflux system permease component RcnA
MIENAEISFDYSLSYREFVAGHKLAARKSVVLFLVHLIGRLIAPCALLLLVAMCLINLFGGHKEVVRPMLPIVFLLIFLSGLLWVGWRFSFNQLKATHGQDPQMTFQADKDSFSRQIHGMGDLNWLWSATHRILDNKKVIVISVRRGSYLFIPRRSVSDAQLQRLKQFLQEHKKA